MSFQEKLLHFRDFPATDRRREMKQRERFSAQDHLLLQEPKLQRIMKIDLENESPPFPYSGNQGRVIHPGILEFLRMDQKQNPPICAGHLQRLRNLSQALRSGEN